MFLNSWGADQSLKLGCVTSAVRLSASISTARSNGSAQFDLANLDCGGLRLLASV